MPKSESLNESEISPRRARDEAQLILGQIHGLVWLCGNDVNSWLKTPTSDEGTEPDLTADDIRRAVAEVHAHFGTVHAALNTGAYDQDLVRVGLSGAQGEAKRKGFLSAVGRLFARGAKTTQNYAARMRSSLRWSGTLIGSLTAALKKEIELVPGAASAGEAIKEIVELILNAAEAPEIRETPGPPAQIRGDTVR
jgi:hypothetical protein